MRLLLVILTVLMFGCGSDKTDDPEPKRDEPRPFAFQLTEELQFALFLTQPWTGGGGDPVLLSATATSALHVKGLPVYIQHDTQQTIRNALGPQRNEDGRILVEAKVHLELASATISTNPPSQRSIYSVVIDELIHAEWYVP
jgi:hypothetical protein